MFDSTPCDAPDSGVTISIDYNWICEQVLRRCKRDELGYMTDEYFIQMMMTLTREQENNNNRDEKVDE